MQKIKYNIKTLWYHKTKIDYYFSKIDYILISAIWVTNHVHVIAGNDKMHWI